MPKFINESGRVYGKLTVLYRHTGDSKDVEWFCRCVCGREVVRRGARLRRGQRNSCGHHGYCADQNTRVDRREKDRRYAERNPEKLKEKQARHRQLRRARKRGATIGVFPTGWWKQVLEQFNNRCFYCGTDGDLTQDHMKPLAAGGIHAPKNMVPACKICNGRKSAQDFYQWITSNPGVARHA